MDLEVIVPAYNEATRLPDTLRAAVDYLAGLPLTSRVVVVDNGSVDGTAAVVDQLDTGSVEVVVIGCSRPGKGAAVRRGLLTSSARFVGFVDADLSTPLDTLARAVAELTSGAEAAIASRHAPGASFVHPRSLGRKVGGSAFRALARPLVTKVRDTQCGFKFFQRSAVQSALLRCRVDGFAFDVELLRQVQADGGRIVELPVAWRDDTRSTFRPLRDGLASFTALLRLYRGAHR
ncbi:glycosyltransferase involved in cell wall biosynthesis [Kutzneria viridogrisea]|uniref:Glycosyltransferase involved in cell wall biosynthesis n=1 Tax=Kutzneria viridogrisea TaxID=47990 RepID=A0ABR6BFA0_9PSEU|nr:glycosyltransferase [Kutzneria albida]MBA8925553.1 glycosyltransferase involved in cell wall biosynthesis [Kutzneria viridogrisea]